MRVFGLETLTPCLHPCDVTCFVWRRRNAIPPVRACERASLRVLYFAAAHLHRRRSLPPPRRVPRAHDGTPATGVFSGYKLCRGGEARGSLLIVCGHVRSRSAARWECQGVGIIADSILRGLENKKPLHQHLWPQTRPPTSPPPPTQPTPTLLPPQ